MTKTLVVSVGGSDCVTVTTLVSTIVLRTLVVEFKGKLMVGRVTMDEALVETPVEIEVPTPVPTVRVNEMPALPEVG